MKPEEIEDIYPLSALQQGILFHEADDPEPGEYMIQARWDIVDGLDRETFTAAWRELIARHTALRTAFFWQGLEEPLQVVRRLVEAPVQFTDASSLAAAEREPWLAAFAEAERARRFDLSQAPLMRLAVVGLGGDCFQAVWTAHHLLLDGWSVALLLEEAERIYRSLRAGRDPALDQARPFADYIAWLGRQDLPAAERFWSKLLAGYRPAPLPSIGPRPAEPLAGPRFQRVRIEIEEESVARLTRFARAERVTSNTVLQGALALLLGRYSMAPDVLIGNVVAGRPAELEGVGRMVGLFLNCLPLRARIPSAGRLGDWLRGLQEQQAEARRYEYAPLPLIQKCCTGEVRGRLFDALLAFENTPAAGGGRRRAGAVAGSLTCFTGRTDYPLTVVANPGERLIIDLFYDTHLFREDAMTRFGSQLKTLLDVVPRHRDKPPGAVSAASEDELCCSLRRSAGPRKEQRPALLHTLVGAWAAINPEAPALVTGDRVVTYLELQQKADELARRIRAQGVLLEAAVGVCLERSAEMVVAQLAVLKAGGVCVPMDPAYPDERLRWMCSDARVALVVTSTPERSCFTGLRSIAWEAEGNGADAAGVAVDAADRLAYVLYTSGSTGRPKGVMISHGSIARLIQGGLPFFVAPTDVFLWFAAMGFDASLLEVWGALTNGAQVVIPPRDCSLEDLAETIERHQVSVMFLTAALFNQFVEAHAERLRAVRHAITGGEVLSPAHLRRAQRAAPGTEFIAAYGPTECTVLSSCYTLPEIPAVEAVPIGRPLPGMRMHVAAQGGSLAEWGTPGELLIGGEGLARGYLGRPDLTAERFVPDSYSGEPGARLYRTGDVARWREDGELDFLGRRDTQVKLKGYRIEPAEIETALLQHAGVREAAVVAREYKPGGLRLVAYVVAQPEAAIDARVLAEHLGTRLPRPLIPAVFVTLDSLPLTSNGKVDRRALPAPPSVAPTDSEEPRTAVEEILSGIWSQALACGPVGRDDDFFALGGHSLLAMRILSRLRAAFGAQIPLRAVFDYPTVRALAAEIGRLRGETAPDDLGPMPRSGPIPLAYSQEPLWFLHQLQPENPFYNVARALAIEGKLEITALRRALAVLVERHESLRTSFVDVDGVPRQWIHQRMEAPVPLIDLEAVPDGRRHIEADRLLTEEAARPFRLSAEALLRVRAVRLGPADYRLACTVHHIVADGISLRILSHEIAALYEAFAAGREPILAPLAVQCADVAIWQRSRPERLDQQFAYWKQKLAGAPPLVTLAPDRPRPAVQDFRGASIEFEMEQAMSERLRELARSEGATTFMTLLSGLVATLHERTGLEDIVVGTPFAGRHHPLIEPLIGCFVNMVALRVAVARTATFRDLLQHVRQVCLEAYENSAVPFQRVVEEIRPRRELSHSPVFQITFSSETAGRNESKAAERLRDATPKAQSAHFDLTVLAADTGSVLRWAVEYDADLYDTETITAFFNSLQLALENAAARPEITLGEMEALLGAQRLEAAKQVRRQMQARAGNNLLAARRRAVALPQRN